MNKIKVVVTGFCLHMACSLGITAHADDYQGVHISKILTSTVAANGQKLSYLKTENPEVKDTPHNGRNNGDQTARLVVFYTGEVGKPNVTRVNMPECK